MEKFKKPKEAVDFVEALLIKNLDAQTNEKTKTNYIAATVAEITNGAKFDQKKHRAFLLRLEYAAQQMMKRHGADSKTGLNSKYVTFADGLEVLVLIGTIAGDPLLEASSWSDWWRWLTGGDPVDPEPPVVDPWVPGPVCQAQINEVNDAARKWNEAKSKLEDCQRLNGGGGSGFPVPIFIDNPLGNAGPPPSQSGSNPCGSFEAQVASTFQDLRNAELDMVNACYGSQR